MDSKVEGNRNLGAYRHTRQKDGSELPGRNESERRGGLESAKTRKPSLQLEGEGKMDRRKLDDTVESFRRGGSDSMVTRTNQATGEALLVPGRNLWSKVDSITVNSGKWIEGERVADGFVVAMNRSNVRGAKEPCC